MHSLLRRLRGTARSAAFERAMSEELELHVARPFHPSTMLGMTLSTVEGSGPRMTRG